MAAIRSRASRQANAMKIVGHCIRKRLCPSLRACMIDTGQIRTCARGLRLCQGPGLHPQTLVSADPLPRRWPCPSKTIQSRNLSGHGPLGSRTGYFPGRCASAVCSSHNDFKMLKSSKLYSLAFFIGNIQLCISCSVELINSELIVHFEKIV